VKLFLERLYGSMVLGEPVTAFPKLLGVLFLVGGFEQLCLGRIFALLKFGNSAKLLAPQGCIYYLVHPMVLLVNSQAMPLMYIFCPPVADVNHIAVSSYEQIIK
jgi:hypothetical protein